MKSLRKRLTWILLALFLLPVLITSIWFNRQARQQRLDHALIEAIKKEDIPAAIALLDQGADANTTDKPYTPTTLKSALADLWKRMKENKPQKDSEYYPTALLLPYHEDDTQDNPKLVKTLLDHGANPYITDENEMTILHWACMLYHPQTVQVLLEHRVNPNIKDHFSGTPLHWADSNCARLLLEYGANVNMQDNGGRTALFIATVHSDVIKVRVLLQYGAKVSIKDKNNETALDYAKVSRYKDIIPLLEAALKKEQAEQKSSATATN